MADLKNKDEKYWKNKLTEDEYKILREKGTEKPFTGELLDNKEDGMYHCKACGNPLFESGTKFESGSGWPSFYDVIEKANVDLKSDNSFGLKRTEVVCSNCGSHLGYLFDDGPNPTGKRYCINSACLNFKSK